jgi:hypothetical protein
MMRSLRRLIFERTFSRSFDRRKALLVLIVRMRISLTTSAITCTHRLPFLLHLHLHIVLIAGHLVVLFLAKLTIFKPRR